MSAHTPSVIHKALVERPWIKKMPRKFNAYRVTPRTTGHGKYELTVGRDGEGNPVVESCVDYRTGEECKGFKFSRGNCYHAARLMIHLNSKAASWEQHGRKEHGSKAA